MYLISPIGILAPFFSVNEPVKMFLPVTFFQARLILTGDDAITELEHWNSGAIKKDQRKFEEDGSFHMPFHAMEKPKIFSKDLQELERVNGNSLVKISYKRTISDLKRGKTLSYRLQAIQVIEEAPAPPIPDQACEARDPYFGFTPVK